MRGEAGWTAQSNQRGDVLVSIKVFKIESYCKNLKLQLKLLTKPRLFAVLLIDYTLKLYMGT